MFDLIKWGIIVYVIVVVIFYIHIKHSHMSITFEKFNKMLLKCSFMDLVIIKSYILKRTIILFLNSV